MNKLQKYVNLIIKMGLNIKQGQKLLIWCPVDAASFAGLVMEEAYKNGAADVDIHWTDDASDRIYCLYASENHFDERQERKRFQTQFWSDERYKMLWVYTVEPEIFKGINPERIQKIQSAMPDISWVLACIPSNAWARKVFPNAINSEEAVRLMWEAIYTASRIDENDSVMNWKKHINNLKCKADTLTAYSFKYLHFINGLGTDLRIELPQNHKWISCTGENSEGEKTFTNIPTEEVFTSPLRTGVNGIVYSTKPFIFMGDIIDGFWLRFKNGKVVDYAAEKNQYLLKKLLTEYENSDYLGEVALVPHSSPVSELNILWYDTSFDENASCHLAFGYGYSQTIKDFRYKNTEEKINMGLNQSLIHEDFMIGSEDMDVAGITQGGNKVQVFKQGEWVI